VSSAGVHLYKCAVTGSGNYYKVTGWSGTRPATTGPRTSTSTVRTGRPIEPRPAAAADAPSSPSPSART
jgi:hypothetical protein